MGWRQCTWNELRTFLKEKSWAIGGKGLRARRPGAVTIRLGLTEPGLAPMGVVPEG